MREGGRWGAVGD